MCSVCAKAKRRSTATATDVATYVFVVVRVAGLLVNMRGKTRLMQVCVQTRVQVWRDEWLGVKV